MGCCNSSQPSSEEIAAQIANKSEYANWKDNKSSRIVIIGAGPAGIHMASLLKKKGFTNITILERNEELTETKNESWNEKGKSVTIKDEEYDCVHEMGTCYTHPKYDEIRKLIKEYDEDNIEIPYASSEKEIIVQVRQYAGSIADKFEDQELKLESLSWNDWVGSQVEKLTIPQILHWLPDTLTDIPLLVAAKKYISLHKEIFGDYDDKNRLNGHYYSDSIQFPPKPNLDLINKTFLEWILENDLQALIPNFIYNQSIQGYGILDEVPALYGLWWNSASLMEVGSDIGRVLRGDPVVFVLKKGFYSIWQSIAIKDKLDIQYGCNVKKMNRNIRYKNEPIEIIYTQKNNGGQNEQGECLIECDVLFTACDMSTFLNVFDATDEEYNIFNTLQAYTLVATLFENDINFEDDEKEYNDKDLSTRFKNKAGVSIYPEFLLRSDGGLYASRNSSLIMNKENYYKMIIDKGIKRERSVGYQFKATSPLKFTDKDKKEYEKALLRDLEKVGKKNVKILVQNVTRYFPKWGQKEINLGYPWIVKDELQGKYKNTYYIGSSVCFESVESVVEYNIELLQRLGIM